MTMHFGDLAAQAADSGVISADAILALRRAGWADGRMSPEEAESLFLANDALTEPGVDWCDFFVEALSTFVVSTVEPSGYVDQEMADELIARIDRDGRVDTMAELELLVRVLEKAVSVPPSLKAYALQALEIAVIEGAGATRHGALDNGGINAAECALLRRLIFAAGSDRPAACSLTEAEALFRIKDATLGAVNAPEWSKLFVQGVANYLLGFGGSEPLSHARAVELEGFMNSQGSGIGAFLGRMARADFDDGFASLLSLQDAEADLLGSLDDQAAASARLEPGEAAWLQDKLDADEDLDELEKALIAFIDAETGATFVPRSSVAD